MPPHLATGREVAVPGSENRHLGLYEGTVTTRESGSDELLGRVKLRVPGLIEPETPNWAEPIGVPGGGHSKRGHFEPPAVGANVAVMFVMGSLTKPRYFPGAWGKPEGVLDTPDGAALEGENRQNAVTEDEEWTVQRDSRSSSKKYLIKHKASGLAILIDASADKVYLVDEAATEALVLGTSYRADEAGMLTTMKTQLIALGTALNSAGVDPVLVALASDAAGFLVTAGAAATAAGNAITSNMASATEYLSTKAFTG
jgi:hypothetical protein